MAWRLHLTNQAIQDLHILNQTLLVWSHRHRVDFYDLQTGVLMGEASIKVPYAENRHTDEWQAFLKTLTMPDGSYFPLVQLADLTIRTTEDGTLHLYQEGTTAFSIATGSTEADLDTSETTGALAIDLDATSGLTAMLDATGHLHIYRQQSKFGRFALNLPSERPLIAISQGGSHIYASDSTKIALVDSSGIIQKVIDTYYDIRVMACSPNGQYLATTDVDAGVIRIYDGPRLKHSYQRFAIDLVAQANQVQLMADLPPAFVAPTILRITDDGRVAFAMSGVICVSSLSHMDKLPR